MKLGRLLDLPLLVSVECKVFQRILRAVWDCKNSVILV
jgi:hypothetical protein